MTSTLHIHAHESGSLSHSCVISWPIRIPTPYIDALCHALYRTHQTLNVALGGLPTADDAEELAAVAGRKVRHETLRHQRLGYLLRDLAVGVAVPDAGRLVVVEVDLQARRRARDASVNLTFDATRLPRRAADLGPLSTWRTMPAVP